MTYEIGARRMEAMDRTDAMSPAHRALVHEFGLPIVTVCMKHGVNSTSAIREIVREIWTGARQAGQRNGAMGALDSLLIQSGSGLSGKGLRRFLADSSFVIVPIEPTSAMLEASMAEVTGHQFKITRAEKHRRRLRAALRAAISDGEVTV